MPYHIMGLKVLRGKYGQHAYLGSLYLLRIHGDGVGKGAQAGTPDENSDRILCLHVWHRVEVWISESDISGPYSTLDWTDFHLHPDTFAPGSFALFLQYSSDRSEHETQPFKLVRKEFVPSPGSISKRPNIHHTIAQYPS